MMQRMQPIRSRAMTRLRQVPEGTRRKFKYAGISLAAIAVVCLSYLAGWKQHERSAFHGKEEQNYVVVPLQKEYGEGVSSAAGPRDPLVAHRQFWRTYTRQGRDPAVPAFKLPIVQDVGIRWLGEMEIGNPGQPFRAIFDTSSAVSWVRQEVQHPADDPFQNRFDPRHSESYEQVGVAKHEFPRGVCGGPLARDVLTLGNASLHMHVNTIHFLNVWRGRLYMETVNFDAVLGLGWTFGFVPQTDEDGEYFSQSLTTPLYSITSQFGEHMANPTFSFHETSDSVEYNAYMLMGKSPGRSTYPLGVHWLSITPDHQKWMVDLDKVSIGTWRGRNRAAVFDVSTRCIIMPESDAAVFFDRAIDKQKKDKKCSALPTISLKMGGQVYELQGTDYGVQIPGGCEVCVLGNPDISWWVLGEVFSKKYQVTYDFANAQIGLPVVQRKRLIVVLALHGCLLAACLLAVLVVRAKRRQQQGLRRTAVATTGTDAPLFGNSARAADPETPAVPSGISAIATEDGGGACVVEEGPFVANRVAEIERQTSARR
mmetsp:Transcript_64357/g.119636  ORF Transcript_64357/g.119636 Transcript_64357/m.119636 type:complete len:541 (+) Transcript_64357:82-1704(+)